MYNQVSYLPIIYNRGWTPGYLEYDYCNSIHIALVVDTGEFMLILKKKPSPKLNVNCDIAHLDNDVVPACLTFTRWATRPT